MNNLIKLTALTVISGLTSWFLGYQFEHEDAVDNAPAIENVANINKAGNVAYGPLSNNFPKAAEGYTSPTHNRNK